MPWSSRVKPHGRLDGAIGPRRPDAVAAAVERLVDLALAWESTGGLRALSGVAEGLAGGPAAGVSGLRPVSPTRRPPTRCGAGSAELVRPARAMLEHVDDDRRRGDRPGRPAHRAARGRRARRPRSCSPAGCWCPADGGSSLVPGEVGLALRGGRTTREPVDDVPDAGDVRARRRRRSTGPRRARRSRRYAGSSCCSTCGAPSRRRRCAAAASACATCRRPRPRCTSTSRRRRCSSRSAAAAGLLATAADARRQPGLAADRRLRRLAAPPGRRALGGAGRGPGSDSPPDAGAGRRRATPPARRGTRWRPSSPRCSLAETRRMALEALAALPPGEVPGLRDRASPSAGGAGRVAAAAPAAARAPTRWCGRSTEAARARGHRARRAGVVRPAAARRRGRRRRRQRWPRCCPSRSTTCCSRPTSPRSRPVRWSPRWPGGCSWSPTSSRGAGRPSTGSRRARSAARSTPAGRRSSCTTSSRRCRGRRCRSR